MISLIKLLKIVLPVATVATATVATVSLVSFKKIDLDKNKDNEDRVLDDLELKAKDFTEKKMLYSKNGKNDSVTLEDDSLTEEILKKFQNNEDLGELEGKVPNIEELKKFLSENKDALTNAPSLFDQEKSDKDAVLPSQLPEKQDVASKPEGIESSGMQNDQRDQDIGAQSPTPKADEKKDQGENNDLNEQKEEGSKITKVPEEQDLQKSLEGEQDKGDENSQEDVTKSSIVAEKSEPQLVEDESKKNEQGSEGGNDTDLTEETKPSESELLGQQLNQEETQPTLEDRSKVGDTVENGKDSLVQEDVSMSVSEPSESKNSGKVDGIENGSNSSDVNSISEETLRELQKLGDQLQSSSEQLENILASLGS